MTGALFGRAAGTVNFDGGWSATFEFVEFSKQTKEGETGADIAFIIDVLTKDGRRAIKTLWFQAKTATDVPDDWRTLPRLEGQMAQMREYTDAAYGLVYTPEATVVVGPDVPAGGRLLEDALTDALRCQRGDQSVGLYAQSIDRLRTYRLLVTEMSA